MKGGKDEAQKEGGGRWEVEGERLGREDAGRGDGGRAEKAQVVG